MESWLAFVSLWASRWILNYNWVITGAILPAIYHGLPASSWQIAAIVAATPIGQGVAEIPGGLVSTRLGPRRTALLGVTLLGLSAVVSSGSAGWEMLAALRFVLGIGSGLFWPSSLGLVRTASPFWSFPTAVGVYNASGGIGVLSGLVLGLALATAVGWRFALLVGGVIQLTFALTMWISIREGPVHVPGTARPRRPFKAREVFRSQSLWALTLAGAGIWGIGYIVPQYALAFAAADHPAWSLGTVALLVSIASLMGIPAGIAGGILASRFHTSRALLVVSALAMGGVGLGFPLVGLGTLGLMLVVFGLANGVALTMLYSIPSRIPEVSSDGLPLAIGVLDSVETLVGSGLALSFGAVVGIFGFGVAWPVVGLATVAPLVLLLWVHERKYQSVVDGPAT
jgi:predicted MFS family arabinose efflux permease